jgi:uncharacterized protein YjiS (DUF1127 family)
MSQTTSSAFDASGIAAPQAVASPRRAGVGIGGFVAALFDGLATWTERRRQRWALERMPDHMLADIGLSRADAEQEAEKPFWRG